jgi:hypothetical protein
MVALEFGMSTAYGRVDLRHARCYLFGTFAGAAMVDPAEDGG